MGTLRVVLGAAILAALAGCALTDYTAGHDIRQEALDRLTIGETGQAEVLRILGPPDDVAELRYGSIWVYRLTEGSARQLELQVYYATGGVQRTTTAFGAIAVIFDRKGVIEAMGLSRPTDT